MEDRPSLNKYIEQLKATCRTLQQRLDVAEPELAKAEATLRNLARCHAAEKTRADRAEAQLRSLGIRTGVAA